MRQVDAQVRARARTVYDLLLKDYSPTGTLLQWGRPWELLVATVLAAQCTDERVNKVTPEFFRRWPGPRELAALDPVIGQAEVEAVIHSTGFFRNKAKNLLACARLVVERFGGELPRTMAEMVQLPGVARKTANIVLTTGYGVVEGIAVDTHAKRLAFRLDFTDADDPVKIEQDLMAAFERAVWGHINHLLVQHGRAVCQARTAFCSRCSLRDLCPKKGVDKSA